MKYEVYLPEYETEADAQSVEATIPSDAVRSRVEALERQRVEFRCAAGEEEITAMVRPLYTGGKWRKMAENHSVWKTNTLLLHDNRRVLTSWAVCSGV